MFDFAFGVAAVFFFLLFLAIFLFITVPLNGTLVRLRANYNPKGLQLDEEDGVQPHTGPVITSFFVMMARVKRLEVCQLGSLVYNIAKLILMFLGRIGMAWSIQRHE